jgi:DNA invertase Pin-like site-specific DNA recombinase
VTDTPHSNGIVHAIGVVRISTDNQREESLEAQKVVCQRVARQAIGAQPEWTWVSSRGSGEHLDRPELEEIERLVGSGRHQLLVAENLDRIMRDAGVIQLLKRCVAAGVRVITNNGFDTQSPQWRLLGSIQAAVSEEEQEKTSTRIKRQWPQEFMNGGCLGTIPWGYLYDPPDGSAGSKNDMHLRKDPRLEPVFIEIVDRLFQGASYADVARWLEQRQISVPGKTNGPWEPHMVARLVREPIRAGIRVFGRTETVKDLMTGKRIPRPTKKPPLTREVDHLRMIPPERHEALLAMLDDRNAHLRLARNRASGRRPRSRKRIYPSQVTTCAICGSLYSCAGSSGSIQGASPLERRRLTCGGKRQKRCWVAAFLHAPKLLDALFRGLVATAEERLGDPARLRAMVGEELADLQGSWRGAVEAARAECGRLEQGQARLIEAAEKTNGPVDALASRIAAIDSEVRSAKASLLRLESNPPTTVEVPSADEVSRMLTELRSGFDPEDGLTVAKLRRVVPRMTAYPFRLIGGTSLFVFVLAEVDLSVFCRPADSAVLRAEVLKNVWLPAFETPRPVALLNGVREGLARGLSPTAISVELGANLGTIRESIRLLDEMERLGLPSPFVPATDPAELSGNGRYRRDPTLVPVPGHTPWTGDLSGLPPLPDLTV